MTANGEASSQVPDPTLISSAARGPDTIGTLSVAARMQAPTIEAFAELASSSEAPKIQGAMNRYAPSDTVAHLHHLVVNVFMPKPSGAGILTPRGGEGPSWSQS
jgi:hypothetical protein